MKKNRSFIRAILFFISFIIFNTSVLGQSEMLPSKGICAHRGANATHPENTISAFKEAVRLGAQMIEFDVQLTKDNQLIIMHDATVDRTTNGTGKVSDLTFNEIRQLDAGAWKSKAFTGEKVPTLQEVLQIMPKTIWLNVHLKGSKKAGLITAETIVTENRILQAVVAGGKQATKIIKRLYPGIKTCNMTRLSSRANYINETIKRKDYFIQIKSSRDDENMLADIKKLKENGIHINYFHSEKETQVQELLDAGVDFILTDNLAVMLEAFSNTN
ncbi:glycerophosphodiester phosphodiesterase [Algibacter pacificus]|uniref:glycerophosphodiester phosphodiesterase n=1 Tax=Algibacter pacificus TaxID=2599389 RepID=UPI0011C853C9|nr:glycerophosphodiester phosphodiesterase family protein [Algibacter pacificus]